MVTLFNNELDMSRTRVATGTSRATNKHACPSTFKSGTALAAPQRHVLTPVFHLRLISECDLTKNIYALCCIASPF